MCTAIQIYHYDTQAKIHEKSIHRRVFMISYVRCAHNAIKVRGPSYMIISLITSEESDCFRNKLQALFES